MDDIVYDDGSKQYTLADYDISDAAECKEKLGPSVGKKDGAESIAVDYAITINGMECMVEISSEESRAKMERFYEYNADRMNCDNSPEPDVISWELQDLDSFNQQAYLLGDTMEGKTYIDIPKDAFLIQNFFGNEPLRAGITFQKQITPDVTIGIHLSDDDRYKDVLTIDGPILDCVYGEFLTVLGRKLQNAKLKKPGARIFPRDIFVKDTEILEGLNGRRVRILDNKPNEFLVTIRKVIRYLANCDVQIEKSPGVELRGVFRDASMAGKELKALMLEISVDENGFESYRYMSDTVPVLCLTSKLCESLSLTDYPRPQLLSSTETAVLIRTYLDKILTRTNQTDFLLTFDDMFGYLGIDYEAHRSKRTRLIAQTFAIIDSYITEGGRRIFEYGEPVKNRTKICSIYLSINR